jgi:hypothetical protein
MSRPSTSLRRGKKDVDARMRGHDEENHTVIASEVKQSRSAYAERDCFVARKSGLPDLRTDGC